MKMTKKLIPELLINMLKYNVLAATNIRILLLLVFMNSCIQPADTVNDQFSLAQARKDDLQLSIYITAHAVKDLLSDEAGRREAVSIFRCNGITKAYIEVYRGGLVIEKELLQDVRDLFEKNRIETAGGIATVPGKNFGVRQKGQLGWFNWQNPKTQADLKEVMLMSADVFDEFIIDDFLCTADTSMESKAAKGERSWSQYRRDLLTELSESVFIGPARSINPEINLIIKYPQWYDRFHLFGYDVERKTALYDEIWVGTESRGQYTKRFGFVQPYESFVSYSWMKSLAGEQMGGAWFDHGDCDENDFIEQAWQSVLAGAGEIILFNYYDFVNGHRGHHLLRKQFTQLADLAGTVAKKPIKGVMAYKPPHSDAQGDLYIMDFMGMLGIPLIPVSRYPINAKVIFLPTQAAADTGILAKIENSITDNATLIFTTGFLAYARDGKKLAEIAGISWPVVASPLTANQIIVAGKAENIKYGLDLESNIKLTEAIAKLTTRHKSGDIPFLVARKKIFTLNSHTFSQVDFDEIGEVLLCPRPLGLLEIPQSWANTLRDAFLTPYGIDFSAPARVALQPYGNTGWVIHNYNRDTVQIGINADGMTDGIIEDKFSGKQVRIRDGQINMEISPRSRLWLETGDI
jgi:hypothetical protein